VPRLVLQKLVVGMRLWGMVLEVTPKGVQVSLPDGLRGAVAPEEVRSEGPEQCVKTHACDTGCGVGVQAGYAWCSHGCRGRCI